MKKIVIQNFFLGLMIAFTNSIIILSAVFAAAGTMVIPVTLIGQAFILSVLCSFINLIYQADRLTFFWQSLLGYILTTSTIISCGLIFDWYGFGWNAFSKGGLLMLSFFAYSFFYLITWVIIWNVTKKKGKSLNDKLEAYKQSR